MGQRITGMTSGQSTLPVTPPIFKFKQYGKSGAWVSELLPHTAKIVDDLTIVKTINTDAINHDPAITFIQTGSQQPGRPSMGSWVSYGLGSENDNLPAFVVMISQAQRHQHRSAAVLAALGQRLSAVQVIKACASAPAAIPCCISTIPRASTRDTRRRHARQHRRTQPQCTAMPTAIPEIETRIAAIRDGVPHANLGARSDGSLEGTRQHLRPLRAGRRASPGTYAANCLLARRLAERNVRFVQLYHRGWDQHNDLPRDLALQCKGTDQPSAALVTDLKQRGLLDDTLVVWGGEFGRTVYCQGKLTDANYGRDHHPRCFTMWIAGGGVKPGTVIGQTDDFGYNVVSDPVHVHDVQATILHCLGIDHERLTFKFQGRRFRLTDVSGSVVKQMLA